MTMAAARIRSMTGFAAVAAGSDELAVDVEIRSVNHRYLGVEFRMPSFLFPLEEKLRRRVKKELRRGAVEVSIFARGPLIAPRCVIDTAVAEACVAQWREMRKKLGIDVDLSPEALFSVPDLFPRAQRAAVSAEVEGMVMEAMGGCLRMLVGMRETEGAELAKDMAARVSKIASMTGKIEALAPRAVKALQGKLRSRVAALLSGVQAARVAGERELEKEIALLADRCDISEELTRLKAHVAQFREGLKGGGEAGRRLDFLLQEMGREINTVGAKGGDSRISRLVIEVKGEIEKIREQVQNVE